MLRLSPWIESLILGYGEQREESHGGQLKARVIEVGDISKSQDVGSEGPAGLLFLSDGLLQIPAILTKSAWEHLQQEEDRECFTSLVNTTVCVHDYQLQFHMASEKTKCRFVLSIRELATTATGPVKGSALCSTALPSIRRKICVTRKALLGQETQDSQYGFDLSELLGEWQQDCLEAVLEDVRERLAAASPQPSTSTSTWDQLATHTDTTWGVDRVKYKGVEGFKVPMKCLLISAENALQNQTPLNVRGGTAGELFAPREDREGSVPPPSESTSPSIDDAEWRVANGEEENAMADVKDLSNPWDAFPPPWETSSSSDASPRRLVDPAAPAADQGRTDSPPPPPPPASDQVEETVEREYGKAKRKRSEPTTWVEEGEAQVSGSSPSWLFDTQAGCRAHEGSSPWKPPRTPARTVPRSTATARRFSYSYLPSGQNLHDFSRFKVAESFLRWAVRYLQTCININIENI
uniref:Shelterin complex subunit TPP1/Est3 domain-containing protein n=1 Tax=Gasterosteus aculeatus aculeatus TaxID=481459 RepID=G3NDB9_GASAC